MSSYAELQVTSNYSFLRGASHPDELVVAAAALGLSAVAVTDRNTLAGVVRAHVAAKQAGLRLVVGARLDFRDGHPSVLAYPTDRAAYGRLSQLLTLGNRRAPKGQCWLDGADLAAHGQGLLVATLDVGESALARLAELFPGACWLVAHNHLDGDDEARMGARAALAARVGVPLLATNDVHYHMAARRPLQDVLVAVREGVPVEQAAGRLLFPNAERHMKAPEAMAHLFRRFPDAVAQTAVLAERCRFSLDELVFDYAADPVPEGETAQGRLERLTLDGARWRYPDGVPDKVARQVEHEFALIGQLGYAPYFLTVHDIVTFARARGILCQGRGSAANSAVCYCLGITAVDPARSDLLFERFVSAERAEPPDIDVDFEHERREEVIQYIYAKYGRDRAGLAASVITYRTRSAIRDVGKALGLSEDTVGALAKTVWGSSGDPLRDQQVREAGVDPTDPRLRLALDLAWELKGFPRHLSQHVGGFVMTRGPLDAVVPIANAAMADRTVIEWDKDDLDALGMLKVDVLALGMLTCIRKAFDLIERHHGRRFDLATVPPEDPAVYDMLCRGDSVGVFQVESRAQMAMLPRLKPRCFYDLVIEVAIVRPGPIQGDMVHPYLRRRAGEEQVSYPSGPLKRVLEKTLGVPLFQEQAMRIAIEGAGFTPAEADRLRRAMATFRRSGQIALFRDKFLAGMAANGFDPAFADACFRQIEGFGEYGFPESHAASFALLVYVSAWLKCRYPAAFACALLNSQPMGFYAPAQIVRDARAHGVEVRPVDVSFSDWDCTLEGTGRVALRLGFRQIAGMPEGEARRLVAARGDGYPDPRALWRRAGLTARGLDALARADAFASMGLGRRDALWAIKGLGDKPLPLFDGPGPEPEVVLPRAGEGEQVVEDYSAIKMTLRRHPLGLLREELNRGGFVTAAKLASLANGSRVRVAGLAITRQRPGSAKGIVFVTLEDESGSINLVVRPPVFEANRAAVMRAALVAVDGRLQRDGLVVHVIAERLTDDTGRLSALLPEATWRHSSRDFH
ncbi:MAG: error-prone DNA polymerase [Actinomycetota bacterium]